MELQSIGKETYEKMKQLSQEFEILKNKNIEFEEKIKLLHENIDKQYATLMDGDIDTYFSRCENKYKSFWNDLDDNSRKFFATAHYLMDKSKSYKTDFSPVIIEFCRIFENEMLEKIFKQFVLHQATLSKVTSYSIPCFGRIEKAVNDQRDRSFFFLSSTDMLNILGCMNRNFKVIGYEQLLQNHIRRNKFNLREVSDRNQFIKPAKEYIDSFRNEAAHPKFLQEDDASQCEIKTKELVGTFLDARCC